MDASVVVRDPFRPTKGSHSARSRSALLSLRGEELVRVAEQIGKETPPLKEVGALPPIPLLSELSKEDFCSVFETMTLVRKKAGERVITQGRGRPELLSGSARRLRHLSR